MKNKWQLLAVLFVIVAAFAFAQGYWGRWIVGTVNGGFAFPLLSPFIHTTGRWIVGTVNVGFTLTILLIGIVIFLENRDPAKTISWLIVLTSFPLVGFVFYIIFGQNYRKRRLFRKKAFIDEETFAKMEQTFPRGEQMKTMGDHQQLLFRLAHNLGKSPISFSTETRVLTDGKETYNAIFEAIRDAREFIHLEYYIVRHDKIGRKFQKLLIEKAQEGVEVRFLYDAVGCWLLSKSYRRELQEAGVQMIPFFPVKLPFLNHRINYRNHRKIVVVDGDIGFIGGLNIGDEYLGRKKKTYGYWRDTHLRVKGEGVRSLQLFFLQDWYYMTGESLLTDKYLSPRPVEKENLGGVQMVASGPDGELESIKSLFFSMIVSAKKSIWIASPYFIPDADILSALRIAALSGIDVRILVPSRPDKRIVFYASRSYFPDLLEVGVKIYEYEKGFMHSKLVVVDGELASIGTANMDMRSFHLNFEVNAFLYRTRSTTELVRDFEEDFRHSTKLVSDRFRKRSIMSRIVESTSRLLSPLL
ncbi:MAG TPA: cardiolipin synthase [Bacillales bacterium]|nr:cardiolipin synthase [Bacillales bacterium]